jgi:predicted small secreted protein
MFNVILSENNIEEILSDGKLSTQAINSYIRLAEGLTNQIFSIKVKLIDGSYIELNKENIIKNSAVISVKETYKGQIKESWIEFNKRYNNINEITGSRSSWGNEYELGRPDIDRIMFLTEIFL